MWLGIAALVLCWTFIGGFVLGILAIVFGAISKGKEPKTGKSTAAIVMGIVAILLPVTSIVAIRVLGDKADTSFDCTSRAIDDDPYNDC